MMIGYYNYTVFPTLLGLASSIIGIVFAMNGEWINALICLMTSGFLDMIDGMVASTKKRSEKEKRFGIQLDSLSDIVCFGVLPVVLGITVCERSFYVYAVFALYVACALIRLAYFNVDEEERQRETTEKRKYYEGLPVTTVSLLIPLLFCAKSLLKTYFSLFYISALLLIAICFIVRFKLKKPDRIGKCIIGFVGVAIFVLLVLNN